MQDQLRLYNNLINIIINHMAITKNLRGLDPFLPSWISSCGSNPNINEILDAIDENTQFKCVKVLSDDADADYVCVGDGVADDTSVFNTALQEVSDNNEVLYVPRHIIIATTGVIVDSKNNWALQVDGIIKQIADNGDPLLTITNCNEVYIPSFRFDGNYTNYTDPTVDEGAHGIRIDGGSSHVYIDYFYGKNLIGDGLYIRDADDIQVNVIDCSGNDTGRNALSVIQGRRLHFANVNSYKVGTPTMPGGIDIEPFSATHVCEDIQIGSAFIDTVGVSGIALYDLGTTSGIKNVTIDNCIVNNRTISATPTGSYGARFRNCSNVKGSLVITHGAVSGSNVQHGLQCDDFHDSELNINISGVDDGIVVGSNINCSRLKFTGLIKDIVGHGLTVNETENIDFDVTVDNVGAGFSYVIHSIGTSDNVKLKGNFNKGTGAFLVRSFTGNMTNWIFKDSSIKGWADTELRNGNDAQQNTLFVNCEGVNYRNTAPTTGYWNEGEIIFNNDNNLGLNSSGWICQRSGDAALSALPAIFRPITKIEKWQDSSVGINHLGTGSEVTVLTPFGFTLKDGEFQDTGKALVFEIAGTTFGTNGSKTVTVREDPGGTVVFSATITPTGGSSDYMIVARVMPRSASLQYVTWRSFSHNDVARCFNGTTSWNTQPGNDITFKLGIDASVGDDVNVNSISVYLES